MLESLSAAQLIKSGILCALISQLRDANRRYVIANLFVVLDFICWNLTGCKEPLSAN